MSPTKRPTKEEVEEEIHQYIKIKTGPMQAEDLYRRHITLIKISTYIRPIKLSELINWAIQESPAHKGFRTEDGNLLPNYKYRAKWKVRNDIRSLIFNNDVVRVERGKYRITKSGIQKIRYLREGAEIEILDRFIDLYGYEPISLEELSAMELREKVEEKEEKYNDSKENRSIKTLRNKYGL